MGKLRADLFNLLEVFYGNRSKVEVGNGAVGFFSADGHNSINSFIFFFSLGRILFNGLCWKAAQ